ncbi:MAG: adenylosuccinate lyase, partial [Deltaproteobacteria bacterium]|nr:adenylosuccinate lyase [Deltaproteobacteria bacterium]
ALGYSVLALESALKGLARVQVNEAVLEKDLESRWEVLAEAVQTVMRKAGIENPYEKMKELTRDQEINREQMRSFIQGLDLPETDKERLLALTPAGYIGIAAKLIRNISE